MLAISCLTSSLMLSFRLDSEFIASAICSSFARIISAICSSFAFPEPIPNVHGFGHNNDTRVMDGFHDYSIVDRVVVPGAAGSTHPGSSAATGVSRP